MAVLNGLFPTQLHATPSNAVYDGAIFVFGGHLQTQAELLKGQSVGAIEQQLVRRNGGLLDPNFAIFLLPEWRNDSVVQKAYKDLHDEISSGQCSANYAVVGYSHGGGVAFDLTQEVDANPQDFPGIQLFYTGYIDAVIRDKNFDSNWPTVNPLQSAPAHSLFTDNFYETNFRLCYGAPLTNVPASVNHLRNTDDSGKPMSHITIDNTPSIQNQIISDLYDAWFLEDLI